MNSVAGALITKGVGNRLIVLDDETHDKAAAMISHMPHVVSTALINADVESARRQLIFYLLDLITLRFWLFLKL